MAKAVRSTLMSKLIKNSKLGDNTSVLSESKFHNNVEQIPTEYPILNIALGGSLEGGVQAGLTCFAGPSKHFKTLMCLLGAKAYLDKHEDAVLMLYDSEGGAPLKYFESVGIDPDRVLHIFVKNLEEMKFDISNQLENIEKDDKVVIVFDSIGNIASKKEVEDAINEKAVADMTRAKQVKSLFRIVTPYLVEKQIPMFVVAHTYQSLDLFPKNVVSGGCLTKGHSVITKDGSKDISELKVGDLVLTHKNRWREVTHTWNDETLIPSKDCYELEFEDGTKMTCSERHKLYINNEWVYVKDLKEGDLVNTKYDSDLS